MSPGAGHKPLLTSGVQRPMVRNRSVRTRNAILATFLASICAMNVSAQRTVTGAGRQHLVDLLAALHSEMWMDRAAAYEELVADPAAMQKPEVRSALLDLLDREDQLIESTLRESHGHIGVSAKYGEGFGEYVGDLGETIDSFGDWNDPREVCIFVRESYDPESKFAAKIASHTKLAVPCLIQMFGSDVGLTRAEAAPVLVQSLAKGKDQLDPATNEKAKETVLAALHDPEEAVRSSTIRALGKLGGEDMIPALRQVANTDPAFVVHGYGYWIRKYAAQAIEDIQKRTHK